MESVYISFPGVKGLKKSHEVNALFRWNLQANLGRGTSKCYLFAQTVNFRFNAKFYYHNLLEYYLITILAAASLHSKGNLNRNTIFYKSCKKIWTYFLKIFLEITSKAIVKFVTLSTFHRLPLSNTLAWQTSPIKLYTYNKCFVSFHSLTITTLQYCFCTLRFLTLIQNSSFLSNNLT